MLTSDQISHIKNFVESSAIRITTLREDLVDHLCCSVEMKLEAGKEFSSAFNEALEELSPNCLSILELETIALLNSKYLPMKKFMYAFGLATTISMSMGLTMKLLHMPGGEELVNFGFLAFALFFLPMTSIKSWYTWNRLNLYEKLRIIFGLISAVGVGIAVFLKLTVQQLQFSSNLLLISVAIFSFGFLPCLFYGMYRKSIIASN